MTNVERCVADVNSMLTVPQTAKALLVSRAGLAQLVWIGDLGSQDGLFDAKEVAELAARRREALSGPRVPRPFGLRGGVQHRVIWLLHEWESEARPIDLSRTLRLDDASISHRLRALHQEGYVEPGVEGWRLTAKGHEYVRRSEPPVP